MAGGLAFCWPGGPAPPGPRPLPGPGPTGVVAACAGGAWVAPLLRLTPQSLAVLSVTVLPGETWVCGCGLTEQT